MYKKREIFEENRKQEMGKETEEEGEKIVCLRERKIKETKIEKEKEGNLWIKLICFS